MLSRLLLNVHDDTKLWAGDVRSRPSLAATRDSDAVRACVSACGLLGWWLGRADLTHRSCAHSAASNCAVVSRAVTQWLAPQRSISLANRSSRWSKLRRRSRSAARCATAAHPRPLPMRGDRCIVAQQHGSCATTAWHGTGPSWHGTGPAAAGRAPAIRRRVRERRSAEGVLRASLQVRPAVHAYVLGTAAYTHHLLTSKSGTRLVPYGTDLPVVHGR